MKEEVINVKSESYSVRDAKRDGNFLFRCFSYYLYETEELHLDVRRNIVKFTIENWDEEQELVKSTCVEKVYKNAEDYEKYMGANNQFGTDYEIGVFVRVYDVTVTVFRADDDRIQEVLTLTASQRENENKMRIMSTGDRRSGHWVLLFKKMNESINIDSKFSNSVKTVQYDSKYNKPKVEEISFQETLKNDENVLKKEKILFQDSGDLSTCNEKNTRQDKSAQKEIDTNKLLNTENNVEGENKFDVIMTAEESFENTIYNDENVWRNDSVDDPVHLINKCNKYVKENEHETQKKKLPNLLYDSFHLDTNNRNDLKVNETDNTVKGEHEGVRMDIQSSEEIPEICDEVFQFGDSNLKDYNTVIVSKINGINSEKQAGRKNMILSDKNNETNEKTTVESKNNFAEKSNVLDVNSFPHRKNKPCYIQNKTIEKENSKDPFKYDDGETLDLQRSLLPIKANSKKPNELVELRIDDKASDSDNESTSDSDSVDEGSIEFEKKNMEQIKKRHKIYTVDLGTYLVKSENFTLVVGMIDEDKARLSIENIMLYTLHCTCTLGFYGGFRHNKQDSVCYATCRHTHKQKFRFCIDHYEEPISKLTILSNDKIRHVHDIAGDPICRSLRKPERIKWRKELRHRKVIDFMTEIQQNTSIDLKNDGHMQDLRTFAVAYKVKSEEKCAERLKATSPDLLDIIQLWIVHQKLADPFVRYFSLTFTVHMYREAEINVFIQEKPLILHMDATGSICRKPQDLNCKRILYHCILAKIKDTIIKLAQMITSENTIENISFFLKKIKGLVLQNSKRWPIAKAITIDWSWAYIHSILLEWNGISIKKYLRIMYEYCEKNTIPNKEMILVKSCYAHFMKNASQTIKTKFREYKEIRKMLLECLALLALARDLKTMDEIFRHVCKFLLCKSAKKSADSLGVISKKKFENSEDLKDIETIHEATDDNDFGINLDEFEGKVDDTIYRSSPFYIRYDTIYREVLNEIKENDDTIVSNKYYAPKFVEHLLTTWMPYVVMWSALDLDLIDKRISRVTNAHVEASNRVLKEVDLEGVSNRSIGDRARELENKANAALADLELDVRLKSKSRAKKPKYPETIPNPTIEEGWMKKKQSKGRKGYEKMIRIQKLNKEFSQVATEENNQVENTNNNDRTVPNSNHKEDKRRKRKLEDSEENIEADGNKKLHLEEIIDEIKTTEEQVNNCFKDIKKRKRKSEKTIISNKKCKISKRKETGKDKKSVDNGNIKKNKIGAFEVEKVIREIRTIRENLCDSAKDIKTSQRKSNDDINAKKESKMCVKSEKNKEDENKEEMTFPGDNNEENVDERSDKYEVTEDLLPVRKLISEKPKKFYNGLIKDVNYYMNSRSSTVSVAKNSINESLTQTLFEVSTLEFSTLRKKNWINGIVIDAFAATNVYLWKNVTYIPTDDSSMVVGEYSHKRINKSQSICKTNKPIKGNLIIPYVYGGHWRLMVVNREKKKLIFLDPYSQETDKDRAFNAFNNFIENCPSNSSLASLRGISWICEELSERPYQPNNDGNSCGCYIMYYMDCIGKQEDFDMDFNPINYRDIVARKILLNSFNMQDVCLNCFQIAISKSVKCEICDRKCHYNCFYKSEVLTDDEEKAITEHTKKKSKANVVVPHNFMCKLCRRYKDGYFTKFDKL